jgi:hypothetical protein
VQTQARDIIAGHECKDGKNRKTKILGFYWLDDSNMLLITTTTIEVLNVRIFFTSDLTNVDCHKNQTNETSQNI